MTKKEISLIGIGVILIAISIYLFASVLSSKRVNAGLWTSIGGALLKTVKPVKSYQIDVIGQNIRAYEFDTQDPKAKRHCIIIFTDSQYKSPVLQCWKIDKR